MMNRLFRFLEFVHFLTVIVLAVAMPIWTALCIVAAMIALTSQDRLAGPFAAVFALLAFGSAMGFMDGYRLERKRWARKANGDM